MCLRATLTASRRVRLEDPVLDLSCTAQRSFHRFQLAIPGQFRIELGSERHESELVVVELQEERPLERRGQQRRAVEVCEIRRNTARRTNQLGRRDLLLAGLDHRLQHLFCGGLVKKRIVVEVDPTLGDPADALIHHLAVDGGSLRSDTLRDDPQRHAASRHLLHPLYLDGRKLLRCT
jgi:hypothetical protein